MEAELDTIEAQIAKLTQQYIEWLQDVIESRQPLSDAKFDSYLRIRANNVQLAKNMRQCRLLLKQQPLRPGKVSKPKRSKGRNPKK